jgi:cytochrome P450
MTRIQPSSSYEIGSILFSLSFAGHETTSGLIGNLVRRLLEDPRRWQEVVDNTELAADAVDETLRYDTSVPAWRRVTKEPTRLGGVDLPQGARLFLWLSAADRDSTVFSDPQRFDLHRPESQRALAFGKGIHYCIGAPLGKLEARLGAARAHVEVPRPAARAGPAAEVPSEHLVSRSSGAVARTTQ